MGAAYSRAFGFCGSDGCELMEPLTFKGRKGSGIAGDRCGYSDKSLRTRWDWEKFLYTYRVWGRLMYNPDSEPDPWCRYLRHHFTEGAEKIESALANASRILPLVTTAHLPSAANNNYWPEIYSNQSLCDTEHPGPYSDTPSPKVFGNVSPLDPQLFSRINDFADELLSGQRSGKYTPIDVAEWLDDFAHAAMKDVYRASEFRDYEPPEYRRLAIDVFIQAHLGYFFASKFRSGVLYRIFEKTADRAALAAALEQYQNARGTWFDLSHVAERYYMSDITVGEQGSLRGHWSDRLAEIDRDIARLTTKLNNGRPGESSTTVSAAIKEVLTDQRRFIPACRHQPPARFTKRRPLALELLVDRPTTTSITSVILYYRHVNQAERFSSMPMRFQGDRYHAAIPDTYTDSPYPLQYYFEIKGAKEQAIYPGLSRDLTQQPYFVVHHQ
jgi:hypothetical protein